MKNRLLKKRHYISARYNELINKKNSDFRGNKCVADDAKAGNNMRGAFTFLQILQDFLCPC